MWLGFHDTFAVYTSKIIRAKCLARLGRQAEAKEIVSSALATDAEIIRTLAPAVQLGLCRVLNDCGMYSDSSGRLESLLTSLNASLSGSGDNSSIRHLRANVLHTLAVSYFGLGKSRAAAERFREASVMRMDLWQNMEPNDVDDERRVVLLSFLAATASADQLVDKETLLGWLKDALPLLEAATEFDRIATLRMISHLSVDNYGPDIIDAQRKYIEELWIQYSQATTINTRLSIMERERETVELVCEGAISRIDLNLVFDSAELLRAREMHNDMLRRRENSPKAMETRAQLKQIEQLLRSIDEMSTHAREEQGSLRTAIAKYRALGGRVAAHSFLTGLPIDELREEAQALESLHSELLESLDASGFRGAISGAVHAFSSKALSGLIEERLADVQAERVQFLYFLDLRGATFLVTALGSFRQGAVVAVRSVASWEGVASVVRDCLCRSAKVLVIVPSAASSVHSLHMIEVDERVLSSSFEVAVIPSVSVFSQLLSDRTTSDPDGVVFGDPTSDLAFAEAESKTGISLYGS